MRHRHVVDLTWDPPTAPSSSVTTVVVDTDTGTMAGRAPPPCAQAAEAFSRTEPGFSDRKPEHTQVQHTQQLKRRDELTNPTEVCSPSKRTHLSYPGQQLQGSSLGTAANSQVLIQSTQNTESNSSEETMTAAFYSQHSTPGERFTSVGVSSSRYGTAPAFGSRAHTAAGRWGGSSYPGQRGSGQGWSGRGWGCPMYQQGYNSRNGTYPPASRYVSTYPWLKQGSRLVPIPGSSDEAAYNIARNGHASNMLMHQSSIAEPFSPNHSVSKNMVYIMRGLPGSGKSTRTAQVVADIKATTSLAREGSVADSTDSLVATHSTDSYFIDSCGQYVFDRNMLQTNHQRNFEAFQQSLAAGTPYIIVDNTNIQPWQFEKYVTAAFRAGYDVQEVVVGEFTREAAGVYAARNAHGVPYETILSMLEQWHTQ
eukprot:jgi/Chrzof1/7249/Cz02g16140.t1